MNRFEAWRSREIVWAKHKKNANGEEIYYTRDGKVMPAEVFRRKFAPLDESTKPEAAGQ